jgi:cytochrome c biogenesis protein CcmG/thiol:disulfide interchange protein DsbE
MAGRTKVVAQGLTLAAVAGLLVLLVWKVVHDERSDVPGQVARGATPMAPSFALPRLDREGELSLASLRGKAVIVNFWASWCDPCKAETPILDRAHRTLQSSGRGTVLGVTYDDSSSASLQFAKDNAMSFPSVRDVGTKLAKRYGTNKIPETFVIDRAGRIVDVFRGQIDQQFMDRALAKAG